MFPQILAFPKRASIFLWIFAALFTLILSPVNIGQASSHIIVTHSDDNKIANDGFCTLREAIIAANQDKQSGGKPGECAAGSGADTIILPAGTYYLSRTDNGKEDAAATGDLDITDDLTIIGDGADVTAVTGNGITDRIFHVLNGSVTISDITILDGNVRGDGGGLYNVADLTLSGVVLTENTADGSGGALYNAAPGSLVMTASTVFDNTAVSHPGIVIGGGTAVFSNNTFTDNLFNAGTTSFNNVTASGAVQNGSGSLAIHNSILASCSGTIDSQGYNLIHNTTNCAIGGDTTDNLLGLDPMLAPLASNGGGTPTQALTLDSPAIEAGDNANCPAVDQRGIERPRGLMCDIGAFELENPPQRGAELFVNTAVDSNDGFCGYDHCSLHEAIQAANSSDDTTTIRFAMPEGNTVTLQTPLPAVTAPIVIDGSTQPEGFVILQPDPAYSGSDGLVISGGSSTVTGLHVLNFPGSGIVLLENGDNTISGSTIAGSGGSGVAIIGVTGNQITGNDIHDNGGLSIDLDGDGRTHNDTNDPDTGANHIQNFPVLTSAVPGDTLTVSGRLNSASNASYTVEFFASPSCNLFGGGSQTFLGTTAVTTDATGDVYFQADGLTAVSPGQFIVSTATDSAGNTSEFSDCIVVGANNTSWPNALPLTVAGDLTETAVDQYLDTAGQSRWYRFAVEPGSKIIVTLTDLPANYDLTIYKDVGAAFTGLTGPQDLVRLGAEFAPDAFSPDAFSPDAFSPDAFSPDAFSPDAFSPDAFSPDAFSPDAFSPDAFSPDAFSPDAFSPDAFSPDAFSPDAFSPDAFSPDAFSPDAFSPDAFSGAQMRSLLTVSAFQGTASEGIVVNTWDNSGYFYVRVRGANSAFDQQQPFHLEVASLSGSCGQVVPVTTANTHTATAGDYKTIILTDFNRLLGTASEKSALQSQLAAFVGRSEVAGVIVDVAADARVTAANIQADAHLTCPYAKNLVAGAIRELVDAYWALNPSLEYVLIVGDDGVVPFFRYPDNAMLANESNYVPPVRDASASQASLRLGYVLGQDAYGSRVDISSKTATLPIPDLAVGRLVETVVDATTMLNAYLTTDGGQVALTTPPLVTGYDFLADAATAVQTELEVGLGTAADSLIAARDLSPADPAAWTAADLQSLLLGSRHDITFLAGHFSANSALAADYSSRLTTSDLVNSAVDLQNAIIFSAGCHAGYNIVDGDGIPLVTRNLDWAQAFAQKGATVLAGTGYQYGDTDFIEYSERLYLAFSRQLRSGTGAVSVGQAMVAAKQDYLASTAQLRGIHEKALIEAALFGFPMLSVDMPGARLTTGDDTSVVSATIPAAANPGQSLGLATADVTVMPLFSQHTVELTGVTDNEPVTAFYLSGRDGVVSNPVEPTLPLEMTNVSVADNVLRGVGFRGGSYTDLSDIIPLSGAPTTEIRGVHAPFQTDVFYPIVPWRINYFAALADPATGATRLAVTPAQFQSNAAGAPDGTLRRFDALDFRLFYSSNVGQFADNSIPALAAPPTIAQVTAVLHNGAVDFTMDVVNNPASGVQAVWVTYTAVNGPLAGVWQSLDLGQNASDSTAWNGSLDLNGTDPLDVRYMVQAANGVGLVSLATNLGRYYIPGVTATGGAPTELTLTAATAAGAYGTQATFSAALTSGGQPAANQLVSIGLGPQTRLALTDENGETAVTLSLLGRPGPYAAKASFSGSADFAASTATTPFTIEKQDTAITLTQPASGFAEADGLLTAVLTDATQRPLGEKSLFFIISGTGGAVSEAVITDYAGRAALGNLALPPGTYSVDVYFGGAVPLHTGDTATYFDDRYNPTLTTGSLELLNHVPTAVDDMYMVNEDSTLVIANANGVLQNEADGDGDSLTAALFTAAAHGSVALSPDGAFVYVPDANFNGVDSFTYVTSDGLATSSPATVTLLINAVNDAATAVDDSYAMNQDTIMTVTAPGILANDTDVENDGLTALLVSGPAHGDLALAADGSFVYTPDAGYYGLDSFAYRANDGALLSNEATVTITVNFVNHPPVCTAAHASTDAIWPANKDFYPVNIVGVTDADGQPLIITITGIFQDEPVGKKADGQGVGTATAVVRAERDGNGDGRVYHIYFSASDGMGGQCSGEVLVPIVPHDQSGDVSAIDGGPLYDSTVRD